MLEISFPIQSFTDLNIGMLCATEEEAEVFLSFLDSVGRRWSDGGSYKENYRWRGAETVYFFNKGTYGTLSWARQNHRQVLDLSDFVVETEMEQDDTRLNEFLSSFTR